MSILCEMCISGAISGLHPASQRGQVESEQWRASLGRPSFQRNGHLKWETASQPSQIIASDRWFTYKFMK